MDKRLIEVIGSGKYVADLGCGSGHLLNSLAERFENRIGLDVSSRRLDVMADGRTDGWRFQEADLNGTFPLEDGTIDTVIANQVIEHIYDPEKFAREIYRITTPGGRCVITTPNIRYLKNIIHLIFSGHGPRTAGGNTLDGPWDDGHIHYFTHGDLRELFEKVGFRMVASRALIDLTDNHLIRRSMDRYAATWPIREFFSGVILLWAEK